MAYAIYVIDVYGASVGASATATVAMLRSILGAAFPLFTIQSKMHFIPSATAPLHLLTAHQCMSDWGMGGRPVYSPSLHSRLVLFHGCFSGVALRCGEIVDSRRSKHSRMGVKVNGLMMSLIRSYLLL